ncbi:MAG: ubiE [Actinomycetospora sp.]|nr:ubiE [Actinomycetospora sp.]
MSGDGSTRWVGSMPEVYARCLVPAVFRPFARELARRAAAHGPRRVLELAAGTGVVTAELLAACPDAHVTASDLNEAMVQLAEPRVPGATWRVADAAQPPFPPGSFDLVVCGFGVMFLPDRPAAYAQVGRVLVPHGRFLFSTWGTLADHGFERDLVRALERLFPGDAPTFLQRVPHGYADTARVADDLRAGGLDVVAIDTVTLEGRADGPEQIAVGYATGSPVRAELTRHGDLDTTVARLTAALTDIVGPGPLTAPMTAHVVEACRPA